MEKVENIINKIEQNILEWQRKKIDEIIGKIAITVNINLSEEEERKRMMIEFMNATDFGVYIDGEKVGEMFSKMPGINPGLNNVEGSIEFHWKITPEELSKLSKNTNGEK